MAEISPLRRRMIEDMTIRNLSPATQQSYIYAVAKFSRHFDRSPDRLGLEDVRAYQLHLIAQQRSWSHVNQTVCALRFFYGVTLGRSDATEQIVAARERSGEHQIVRGIDQLVQPRFVRDAVQHDAQARVVAHALQVGHAARGQVVQHDHAPPRRQQGLDQVAADEARAAGDQRGTHKHVFSRAAQDRAAPRAERPLPAPR